MLACELLVHEAYDGDLSVRAHVDPLPQVRKAVDRAMLPASKW